LVPKLAGPKKVERSGSGKLVEVYPKAALLSWGLKPTSKKQTKALFAALLSTTSAWLHIPDEMRATLQANRDALDSLIAALIARAAAVALCESIPREALPRVSQEGWIALPRSDSLNKLI
jgi:predicted RNase H-like nuclease